MPQIVADSAEPGEVLIHLLLGLVAADLELSREAESAEAVGESVRHGLDPVPHLGGHLVDRHPERPRADEVVQVLTGVERLDQPLVARQVRHDPHLDLAVVGRHQCLEFGSAARGSDDEAVADLSAGLGADRDVLQVRVGRGQPSGGRDRLVEGGVDAIVVGDRLEQSVDSDAQPGGVTVFEQVREERVLGLLVQALQCIGVGGVTGLGLLRLGHVELVEQHRLQLFGRAQVDLLPDHLVSGVGGRTHPIGELLFQFMKVLGVHCDSGRLQVGEDERQRQFHVGEQ